MTRDDIQLLFDYNYWANRRLLATAAQAAPEQLTQTLPLPWGTILGTFGHILGAEWAWRQRCHEGISPAALLDLDQFSTLDVLVQRWNQEEAAMRAYLATLDEAALHGPIHYKNTRGQAFTRTLWHLLAHVVNHGTQHRAEIAVFLTQFGHSPGDMDLSLFLTERAG